MSTSAVEQLRRLRGAPSLVLFLVQEVGCWVVGSRADFEVDRVKPDSDWDLLVPWERWRAAVGALPLAIVKPTARGGWRVDAYPGPRIDVFPGNIGEWLEQPLTGGAWHPRSGTVVRVARAALREERAEGA